MLDKILQFIADELEFIKNIIKLLSVARGGTGANNPADARKNLEVTKIIKPFYIMNSSWCGKNHENVLAKIEIPEAGDYLIMGELIQGFTEGTPTVISYIISTPGRDNHILRTSSWGGGGATVSTIEHYDEATTISFIVYMDKDAYLPNYRINFKAIRLS